MGAACTALHIGRKGHRSGGTLSPMLTRRDLGALVLLMGCGPTTISVTTTGAVGSEGADDTTTTTSVGGTETGLVDTSGHDGASSSSEGHGGSSTGDQGSTSTGGPGPVCFVDPADERCACTLENGTVVHDVDPALCSCIVPAAGECWCGDGCPNSPCNEWSLETCGACYDPTTGACECPLVLVGAGCFCGDMPLPLDACDIGGSSSTG